MIKMDKATAEKMVNTLTRAHDLMYCTETVEVQDGSRMANYFAKKKAIIEALTQTPVVPPDPKPQGEAEPEFPALGEKESRIQWAYRVGLKLDRWVTLTGLDNFERIESAVIQFIKMKNEAVPLLQEVAPNNTGGSN